MPVKMVLAWKQRQENECERDTYVTEITTLNSGDADFNPVIYQGDKLIFTSSTRYVDR
ncbi:MAG: hypothetical protein IPQ11_16690 [Bacteroidetes bacterium]|nr:hypothetical protein [Bacteroidota bacterium]